MIEVKVREVTFTGVAIVEHRWRGLDTNHDTIERTWRTFGYARDLPAHITRTNQWYEDMGYAPD